MPDFLDFLYIFFMIYLTIIIVNKKKRNISFVIQGRGIYRFPDSLTINIGIYVSIHKTLKNTFPEVFTFHL